MAHPRRSKKSYLLDPRFQLKWTGYLVVVVLLVMVGLGFVIASTANRAADTASLAVSEAERATQESKSNNILVRRNMELGQEENPVLQQVMDESLAEEEKKADAKLAAVRERQERIAEDRVRIRLSLVGAAGLIVLVLLLMGIVITHRIVGPVHKMKRLLRRVSTGRLVIEERLRRGDELEDLFDTFLQMTYSLRAQQNARLATLDGTLKRAEATDTPGEVIDGLRALRAQLVLGLEPRKPSVAPPAKETL